MGLGAGKFLDNALDTFTGRKQADMASAEQKRRMANALAEYNVYSSGGYYDDEDIRNGVETKGGNTGYTQKNAGQIGIVDSKVAATGKGIKGVSNPKQTSKVENKLVDTKLKSFDDMQRDIVDEQASGKAASVSQYDRTTSSPMKALYNASISGNMSRAMGGSLGGTASRGTNRTISQGITNADNEMYSRAQDMAGTMKQSALANLQAASAGRANIHQGQAQQVQAGQSPLQMMNNAMNTYKNVSGAFAKSGK